MRRTAIALLVLSTLAVAWAQPTLTSVLGAFAGRGYDIVHERVKPTVVKLTYNDDTKEYLRWQNQEYKVADIFYTTNTPRTNFDTRTRVVQRFEQHFEQRVKTTSITASLTFQNVTLNAAFSNTKGQINDLLKNGTNAFTSVHNEISFFQVGMYLPWDENEYDSRFAAHVASLPRTYGGLTDKAYGRFIATWGTHYVISAQYGAKVNLTQSFSESEIKKNSIQWAERNTQISIGFAMFQLGFNSGLATNRTDYDQQFTQSSNMTKEILGGEGYILERDGFGPWIESAHTKPALILEESELAPISDLIFDPEIAANVGSALIDYCTNLNFNLMSNKLAKLHPVFLNAEEKASERHHYRF